MRLAMVLFPIAVEPVTTNVGWSTSVSNSLTNRAASHVTAS